MLGNVFLGVWCLRGMKALQRAVGLTAHLTQMSTLPHDAALSNQSSEHEIVPSIRNEIHPSSSACCKVIAAVRLQKPLDTSFSCSAAKATYTPTRTKPFIDVGTKPILGIEPFAMPGVVSIPTILMLVKFVCVHKSVAAGLF